MAIPTKAFWELPPEEPPLPPPLNVLRAVQFLSKFLNTIVDYTDLALLLHFPSH
jgi:hypothetical protein